ncbi:MAG: MlaD family protein [Aureispira sp.]
MRNEVKIGILGAFAIVLLFWGYNFLQGKNVFSTDIVVNANFKTVDGLNIAAPVTINGYKVGAVTNIKPSEDYSEVVVELNIHSGTAVPKDAVALLVQPSLMGGKEISLKFTGRCTGNCIESGGTLRGNTSGMMESIMEVADPYMGKIDTILGAISQLSVDDNKDLQRTFNELQGVVTNVRVLTDLVNNLLVSSSVNIASSLSNLKEITGNIKDNNGEITGMLQNLNAITQQVEDANLKATIESAQKALDEMAAVVNGLEGTLGKANGLMDNVNKITDFDNQEGLMAALFNDPSFKGDIEEALENINLLAEDIRLHPERYRTVLSGKHKPYVAPK